MSARLTLEEVERRITEWNHCTASEFSCSAADTKRYHAELAEVVATLRAWSSMA
jgi:hypothetical protein